MVVRMGVALFEKKHACLTKELRPLPSAARLENFGHGRMTRSCGDPRISRD